MIEAAKRKKAAVTLDSSIDTLDAQISALFIKQGNALVRALNPLRKLIKEDAVSDQFDQIFDAATQNTSVDMLEAMRKGYSSALLLGSKDQLSEVGIKISFSLDNPRAAAYIQAYGADQITWIDNHTREDIRNLLRAGIENGASYDGIAKAIKARYAHYMEGSPQQHIRSRARLIAITECGNGYQAGNFTSMQAAQDTGIKMVKRWLTIGDDRVSEGCKTNAAGGWIPLNKQHTSGHMHPLRFPGDRCVEQYKRDSTAKPIIPAKPIVKPQAEPKPKTKPSLSTDQLKYDSETGKKIDSALGNIFPNTTPTWNGVIENVSMKQLGLFYPKPRNDGKIQMSTSYDGPKAWDEKFKGYVHELIHSRSKGVNDFHLEGAGWEEAVVEYNAQRYAESIGKTLGFSLRDKTAFDKSFATHPYQKWIGPLNAALDELGIDKETWYKEALTKECYLRARELRQAYQKKYPKGSTARDKMLALGKAMK